MNIGQPVFLRHEGELYRGIVIKVFDEDLKIELKNGTILFRKFWEIRKINNE